MVFGDPVVGFATLRIAADAMARTVRPSYANGPMSISLNCSELSALHPNTVHEFAKRTYWGRNLMEVSAREAILRGLLENQPDRCRDDDERCYLKQAHDFLSYALPTFWDSARRARS